MQISRLLLNVQCVFSYRKLVCLAHTVVFYFLLIVLLVCLCNWNLSITQLLAALLTVNYNFIVCDETGTPKENPQDKGENIQSPHRETSAGQYRLSTNTLVGAEVELMCCSLLTPLVALLLFCAWSQAGVYGPQQGQRASSKSFFSVLKANWHPQTRLALVPVR